MKKIRQLITGDAVPTTEFPEKITIHTHCPAKWRFVDLETGEAWLWNKETKSFEADDLINTMAFDADDEEN